MLKPNDKGNYNPQRQNVIHKKGTLKDDFFKRHQMQAIQ
jgi:hypothetical protein